MSSRAPGPQQFFDAESAAFDAHYRDDASFEERATLWESLIDSYGDERAAVLDVGCGSGVLACHAAARQMRVTGIDPAPRMLELAEARRRKANLGNVEFRQGELRDITGSYDLVLCSSVLEYIEDLPLAIETLARAVAPGGYLLASLPNARSLYRKLETLAFRITGRPRYRALLRSLETPEAIAAIAGRLSLAAVETRYYARRHRLQRFDRRLPDRYAATMFVTVFHRSGR